MKDSEEVKNLKAQLAELKKGLESQVVEGLRADTKWLRDELDKALLHLAERDALLREVLAGLWPSTPLSIKINAALSASAEPSAPDCSTCNDEGAVGNILDTVPCPDCAAAPPVERDERAAFDPLEWLETEIIAVDTWYRGSPSYEHDAGWMKDQALRLVAEARAALERKPS